MTTFLGADVSANHAGFVLINDDFGILDFRFITTVVGAVKKSKGLGVHYRKHEADPKDPHLREMHRLDFMWKTFVDFLDELNPGFAALEGYAFGEAQGEHIGEVTGCFKYLLWRRRIPFRIVDVSSLKMYAAHNGNAKKDVVARKVKRRWGVTFEGTDAGLKSAKDVPEDLTDAYVLARLALVEWKIREGYMTPKDLEHAKERQIFVRTTKTMPTNVLARSWTGKQYLDW